MQLCSHEMLCWQVVTWNMYLKVTTDVSFVDPWMPVWVLVIKMYIVYSSSLQGGMIRNSCFHIMHMYFTDLNTWQVCCWGIMLLRQCVRSFLMLLSFLRQVVRALYHVAMALLSVSVACYVGFKGLCAVPCFRGRSVPIWQHSHL